MQIHTKSKLFIFTLLFFTAPIFAWNSVGHRLVAQIAYDQLTPQAKQKVDELTQVMFRSRFSDARFSRASAWPDQIRNKAPQYTAWHYINLPIVKDDITPLPLDPKNNVVWAIPYAEKMVTDNSQTPAERAKYLSFLVHFIGDIHQPLHCVTLYDHQFPQGDAGGNQFHIDSSSAHSLHAFWDQGLGLFVSPEDHYIFHYYEIQSMAKAWMKMYPRAYFAKQLQESSPMQWAQASRDIAAKNVYDLEQNCQPSQTYVQNGQVIVRQQIVLAGYRLADTLNHLFQKG